MFFNQRARQAALLAFARNVVRAKGSLVLKTLSKHLKFVARADACSREVCFGLCFGVKSEFGVHHAAWMMCVCIGFVDHALVTGFLNAKLRWILF